MQAEISPVAVRTLLPVAVRTLLRVIQTLMLYAQAAAFRNLQRLQRSGLSAKRIGKDAGGNARVLAVHQLIFLCLTRRRATTSSDHIQLSRSVHEAVASGATSIEVVSQSKE